MPCFRNRITGMLGCAILAALVGLTGCSGQPKPQENPAVKHLRALCQAYDLACIHGKRPRSLEDLKPQLQTIYDKEDPESFLRSPNDGEPYEITWGVQLDRVTDGGLIVAYEQVGKDGKRYVMTAMRIVRQITDDEFDRGSFAQGKKPPKTKRAPASP